MVSQLSALERLVHKGERTLPPAVAEFLLQLEFSPEDHDRYQQLSAKAQRGSLTEEETVQLDDLLLANNVLIILRSRARKALGRRIPAA